MYHLQVVADKDYNQGSQVYLATITSEIKLDLVLSWKPSDGLCWH